jgi:acetaldehyde dehydrogenase (acetylating)|tara:strand:+ start:509 stop:883 length:375 start_codon:yes stop_codon:yes gene_type:complete
MKISKNDLIGFINEEVDNELKDLQEKQWYDIKVRGGKSPSSKSGKKRAPRKKKAQAMEEEDKLIKSPESDDVDPVEMLKDAIESMDRVRDLALKAIEALGGEAQEEPAAPDAPEDEPASDVPFE